MPSEGKNRRRRNRSGLYQMVTASECRYRWLHVTAPYIEAHPLGEKTRAKAGAGWDSKDGSRKMGAPVGKNADKLALGNVRLHVSLRKVGKAQTLERSVQEKARAVEH